MYSSQKRERKSLETKNDFIPDETEGFVQQPLFNYTKYLLRVGYVVGSCPLKNLFLGKCFNDLKSQVISLDCLYSLILYIYKVTATVQLFNLIFGMHNSPMNFPRSTTDTVAGSLGFVFTFCFGIFAQKMSVINLKAYLRALKQIESFDEEFPIMESNPSRSIFMQRLQKVRFIFTFLTAAVMIYTPARIAYNVTFLNPDNPVIALLPRIYTDNKFVIFFYLTFAFIIREVGVTFCYFQIFSMAGHLAYRLRYITRLVEEKLAEDNTKGKERQSWAAISKQYIGFMERIEIYRNFATGYFVILFSTGMISSVCMIYVRTNLSAVPAAGAYDTADFVLCVTLSTIWFLAESGDVFQRKSRVLVKAVMMASLKCVDGYMAKDEQLNGLIKMVTTHKPYIWAGGFFLVSRKNVTSIMSVIITYVLVLIEFRHTDRSSGAQIVSFLKSTTSAFNTNSTDLD